jgi:hypothetical protein
MLERRIADLLNWVRPSNAAGHRKLTLMLVFPGRASLKRKPESHPGEYAMPMRGKAGDTAGASVGTPGSPGTSPSG